MASVATGINGRRDQIGIMTDLLQNMQESRKLTHILYASNMSYGQLVKYLNTMIEMGLVEELHMPYRAYKMTTDGKLFVDLIKKSDQVASNEDPILGQRGADHE